MKSSLIIISRLLKSNKTFIDEIIKYEEDCVCTMKRERSLM